MPPLAGLKILELARIHAGPWAGQLLADLGADVIKVESIGGDDTRQWGPPFVDNGDGTRDSAYFHSTNRRKRSISVDFSKPEGREIVATLAARSDVVIENFKVGGLKASRRAMATSSSPSATTGSSGVFAKRSACRCCPTIRFLSPTNCAFGIVSRSLARWVSG